MNHVCSFFFFFSFPFHFRNHPDFLHLHKHSSVFSALQPADEVQREVRFDLRKFPLLHGVMNFGRLGFRFYKKSSPRCTHQVAKMLKGMITRKIKRKKPKVIWKAIKESEQVQLAKQKTCESTITKECKGSSVNKANNQRLLVVDFRHMTTSSVVLSRAKQ